MKSEGRIERRLKITSISIPVVDLGHKAGGGKLFLKNNK